MYDVYDQDWEQKVEQFRKVLDQTDTPEQAFPEYFREYFHPKRQGRRWLAGAIGLVVVVGLYTEYYAIANDNSLSNSDSPALTGNPTLANMPVANQSQIIYEQSQQGNR